MDAKAAAAIAELDAMPTVRRSVWSSMQDARNALQAIDFIRHAAKPGWQDEAATCKARFLDRIAKLSPQLHEYPDDQQKLETIRLAAEQLDVSSREQLNALEKLEEDLNPIKSPTAEEMQAFLADLHREKGGRS